jgi:mRNA interferase MazF
MGLVDRFDVYLVNLEPTVGSEIKKTRPALVISPNEINHNIATVIIAPMTTGGKLYPTRVECEFEGKQGKIVLDQLRTIDKSRLVKKLGQISDPHTQAEVLRVLAEMFAP